MADRRNLSIPVNLAFLAALVMVSHLVTTTPPAERDVVETPDSRSAGTPQAAAASVDDPPAALATMMLTAVSMPPLPDATMSVMPGAGTDAPTPPASPAARQDETSQPLSMTPEQTAHETPLDPATVTLFTPGLPPLKPLQEQTRQLVPTPVSPISPDKTPAAMLPDLSATAQVTKTEQLRGGRSHALRIPPLEPIAPERQRRVDIMPPTLPAPPSAAALSNADRLIPASAQSPARSPSGSPSGSATTARQAEQAGLQASDLQAADRLMDKAAEKLSLEFLWPADRRSHADIYARLTQCLGVETGVVDRTRSVHLGNGAGRTFNASLHSPFLRLVDQPVDPRERLIIDQIRTGRHFDVRGARPVRVFRRAQDVWLLAALNRVFRGLPANGSVTAEYQMDGDALYLGKLVLDGRRYDGRVRLDHDGCR